MKFQQYEVCILLQVIIRYNGYIYGQPLIKCAILKCTLICRAGNQYMNNSESTNVSIYQKSTSTISASESSITDGNNKFEITRMIFLNVSVVYYLSEVNVPIILNLR
jgi:hypothetical protein